ncbi:hypothetical protein I6U52_21285 [Serratia marcescens]|nr:hypothetical protein [Serratia marcescens]MBH2865740.1 hypothetical protein [Serratia marcescens]MBW4239674.1 hypothetical protein [Enterobacter roggenkampii]
MMSFLFYNQKLNESHLLCEYINKKLKSFRKITYGLSNNDVKFTLELDGFFNTVSLLGTYTFNWYCFMQSILYIDNVNAGGNAAVFLSSLQRYIKKLTKIFLNIKGSLLHLRKNWRWRRYCIMYNKHHFHVIASISELRSAYLSIEQLLKLKI